MALRTIRQMGDEILTKKCRELKEVTPRMKELIEDMLETMYEGNGVGLAAPQVTYIMHELKDLGVPVDDEITTVEEARDAILKLLGGGKDD